MMEKNSVNTDKPAFPNNFVSPKNQGMTLRDYFAAKVMQAIICQKDENDGGLESFSIAWIAYQVADAMLKAREK